MASLLDLTLVVQIVHFVAAYWILSKLFLKPAYAHIMKIENARKELQNSIVAMQSDLLNQRKNNTEALSTAQRELVGELVNIEPAVVTDISQEEHVAFEELPDDARKEIVSHAVQLLKNQIVRGAVNDHN